MNRQWATVNRLLPFSCVDGPGNRLVIFLQGCNFNCLNCHNPYTIKVCQECGDCVDYCPNEALSFQHGKVEWQPSLCEQCDTCISTCSNNSTPMYYRYSLDELLAVVKKYLPFLTGITLSGGEATLQLPFIERFFSAIKQEETLRYLTCFIDSNGYLSKQGWEKVMTCMDGAMIDLKAWDNQVHKYLTGRDNQRVKESIRYLASLNRLYEVRLLLIPNQTDLQDNAEEIATFLLALQPDIRVRINAFHAHGVTGIAKNWMSATQHDVEVFASKLKQHGINNIIYPSVYLA